MQTVIHLTSAEPRHAGHAMRSAALLRGHDDLPHDEVTLVTHREALPGVTVVPSGVAEVVRLQAAGANDVKVP